MRITRINTTEPLACPDVPDLSLLDPLIVKHKGKKGNLIPLLQGAQELYGFIPRAAFEKLAAETGIPMSDMFGVATFYAQFRLAPVGKNIIKVCHGTACHVQNAVEITEAIEEALKIKDGETTEDRFYTLESVACLGCCSLAPVMMIGEQTYGKLTGNEAVKIVKNIKLSAITHNS
jgi:NADH-quinone oxidoreductase subunit E